MSWLSGSPPGKTEDSPASGQQLPPQTSAASTQNPPTKDKEGGQAESSEEEAQAESSEEEGQGEPEREEGQEEEIRFIKQGRPFKTIADRTYTHFCERCNIYRTITPSSLKRHHNTCGGQFFASVSFEFCC